MKRLAVMGGGPKAAALVAKCHVLRNFCKVPELVILERHALAANWTGKGGHTDGLQTLGTPPEKDVGFPYYFSLLDPVINAEVNRRLFALSWPQFLVAQGTYAEWIDRGKPQPLHREYAQYLEWVFDECKDSFDLRIGRVTSIVRDGNSTWKIHYGEGDEASEVISDGLVITGPGSPKRIHGQPRRRSARIFDGRDYWLRSLPTKAQSIAVIGAGETAASIAVHAALSRPRGSVEIINPYGVLLSRGESFTENSLFTSPKGWARRPESHRAELLGRADRGVFSVHAQAILTPLHNVSVVPGRAKILATDRSEVNLEISYGQGQPIQKTYDAVVVAVGFLSTSFLELFSKGALADVCLASRYEGDAQAVPFCLRTRAYFEVKGLNRAISQAIGPQLEIQDFQPLLHLPMSAAMAQGPGFPNLSCLGLMADRVLEAYIDHG